MIAIDTNVLLRFLFKPVDNKNPKWQVDVAEALINKADKVFISSIVIAETEWVLESVKWAPLSRQYLSQIKRASIPLQQIGAVPFFLLKKPVYH